MADGGEPLWKQYVSVKTGSVDWVGLAKLAAGSLAVVIGLGYSMVIEALFGVPAHLFGSLASFVGDATAGGVAWLTSVRGVLAGAAAMFGSLGPLGPVLALTIALVALYVYQEVTPRG